MLNQTMKIPETDPNRILLLELFAALKQTHPQVIEEMKTKIEKRFNNLPDQNKFGTKPSWEQFFREFGIDAKL
jgi:hypothetical protein